MWHLHPPHLAVRSTLAKHVWATVSSVDGARLRQQSSTMGQLDLSARTNMSRDGIATTSIRLRNACQAMLVMEPLASALSLRQGRVIQKPTARPPARSHLSLKV